MICHRIFLSVPGIVVISIFTSLLKSSAGLIPDTDHNETSNNIVRQPSYFSYTTTPRPSQATTKKPSLLVLHSTTPTQWIEDNPLNNPMVTFNPYSRSSSYHSSSYTSDESTLPEYEYEDVTELNAAGLPQKRTRIKIRIRHRPSGLGRRPHYSYRQRQRSN